MTSTSRRDLARVGAQLGDTDGRLFATVLRALASPQSGTIGTPECREVVAAQVYAEADTDDPDLAARFVDTFLDVHAIEDLGDVNALLGREPFERRNYEGQLAAATAE